MAHEYISKLASQYISHVVCRSWHPAIVKLKDADGLAETELFQNELQVQLDVKHRMILRRAREVNEMQQMKLLLTEHLSAQPSSKRCTVFVCINLCLRYTQRIQEAEAEREAEPVRCREGSRVESW